MTASTTCDQDPVPFQAILFDLDGTLVDSTGPTERAWYRWAREEGLEASYQHTDHGKPALSIVRKHVPPERVDAAMGRIIAIELAETEGVIPKPGAVELLNRLPEGSWAIVTSCTRALAEVRMAAAGITVPEILVTVDDVRTGKPDPEGFQQAARRLGVEASECLAVEDTPTGLAAARSAGCTTVAVSGTFPAGELPADIVLASLGDIRFEVSPGGLVVSA